MLDHLDCQKKGETDIRLNVGMRGRGGNEEMYIGNEHRALSTSFLRLAKWLGRGHIPFFTRLQAHGITNELMAAAAKERRMV